MSNEVTQLGEASELLSEKNSKQSRLKSITWSLTRGLMALVGVCLLWESIRIVFNFDSTTMPSAWSIWQKFFSRNSQGELLYIFLFKNMLITGRGAVLGLLLGVISGVAIGVMISTNRLLRRALLPLVISAQTVPIVAVAPAVVLFFWYWYVEQNSNCGISYILSGCSHHSSRDSVSSCRFNKSHEDLQFVVVDSPDDCEDTFRIAIDFCGA